ncbi:unnamed protein product [Parajaminaea phylloscopi]
MFEHEKRLLCELNKLNGLRGEPAGERCAVTGTDYVETTHIAPYSDLQDLSLTAYLIAMGWLPEQLAARNAKRDRLQSVVPLKLLFNRMLDDEREPHLVLLPIGIDSMIQQTIRFLQAEEQRAQGQTVWELRVESLARTLSTHALFGLPLWRYGLYFLPESTEDGIDAWDSIFYVNNTGRRRIHGSMNQGKVPVEFEDSEGFREVPQSDLFLDPLAVVAQAVMAICRRSRRQNLPHLHPHFELAMTRARFWLRLLESPYPSWWRSPYMRKKAREAEVALPSAEGPETRTPRRNFLPQRYASEVSSARFASSSSSGDDEPSRGARTDGARPALFPSAHSGAKRATSDKADPAVASVRQKLSASRRRQNALLAALVDLLAGWDQEHSDRLLSRGTGAVAGGREAREQCWALAHEAKHHFYDISSSTDQDDILAADESRTLSTVMSATSCRD